jgi:TolA-binding protein
MKRTLLLLAVAVVASAQSSPAPKVSDSLRAQIAVVQRDENADIAQANQGQIAYQTSQKKILDDYQVKVAQLQTLTDQVFAEAKVSKSDYRFDTDSLELVAIPKPPIAAPVTKPTPAVKK